MNILLFNPTIRENQVPYNFPAGLGIIASIMVQEGHNVSVYDQNALRTSNDEVLRELSKFKNIDIIGIGGLVTTYSQIKSLIPIFRSLFKNAKIVLGGGVTIDPDLIFKNMDVDICVHGEGEHTFRILCNYIEGGRDDFSDIPGVSYIKNNELFRTQPNIFEKDLNVFPMPAYNLFPSEIYFKNNVLKQMFSDLNTKSCATLLWSRGCPNECTYCWRMTGKALRFRSMTLLMEEIEYLRSNYDVDSYLFYDECINANRAKALEFSSNLIKRGLSAPWYSHARANNFDDEIASMFFKSGCVGLNFGIESGSEKMLRAMKKNINPVKAGAGISIALRNHIKPNCTFIIGMPGETRETVAESVKWIRKYKSRRNVFFFATPYPGCELYNEPIVQKRIYEKYNNLDNYFSALGDAVDLTVNMTDLDDRQLIKLKIWAEKRSRGNFLKRKIKLFNK